MSGLLIITLFIRVLILLLIVGWRHDLQNEWPFIIIY